MANDSKKNDGCLLELGNAVLGAVGVVLLLPFVLHLLLSWYFGDSLLAAFGAIITTPAALVIFLAGIFFLILPFSSSRGSRRRDRN